MTCLGAALIRTESASDRPDRVEANAFGRLLALAVLKMAPAGCAPLTGGRAHETYVLRCRACPA